MALYGAYVRSTISKSRSEGRFPSGRFGKFAPLRGKNSAPTGTHARARWPNANAHKSLMHANPSRYVRAMFRAHLKQIGSNFARFGLATNSGPRGGAAL